MPALYNTKVTIVIKITTSYIQNIEASVIDCIKRPYKRVQLLMAADCIGKRDLCTAMEIIGKVWRYLEVEIF